jgi:hypothetical protein
MANSSGSDTDPVACERCGAGTQKTYASGILYLCGSTFGHWGKRDDDEWDLICTACSSCDGTGLAETPHGGLPLSMFACSCPKGVDVAKRSDEARHG